VERAIRLLENAAMAVAIVCVVVIMLVVSADAISRYAFNAPLPVTFELVTYYLLIAAIYLAMSATFRRGDHINIDLIQNHLPAGVRRWADIVSSLLAAFVFTLVAYGALTHAIEAYVRKEFMPGYIIWPVWLSYLPIPIGAAVLVLRLLHHSLMLAGPGADPFVHTHLVEGKAE
jgi:TRAP-type C4-dicarboxylate transport system permease small subunit